MVRRLIQRKLVVFKQRQKPCWWCRPICAARPLKSGHRNLNRSLWQLLFFVVAARRQKNEQLQHQKCDQCNCKHNPARRTLTKRRAALDLVIGYRKQLRRRRECPGPAWLRGRGCCSCCCCSRCCGWRRYQNARAANGNIAAIAATVRHRWSIVGAFLAAAAVVGCAVVHRSA